MQMPIIFVWCPFRFLSLSLVSRVIIPERSARIPVSCTTYHLLCPRGHCYANHIRSRRALCDLHIHTEPPSMIALVVIRKASRVDGPVYCCRSTRWVRNKQCVSYSCREHFHQCTAVPTVDQCVASHLYLHLDRGFESCGDVTRSTIFLAGDLGVESEYFFTKSIRLCRRRKKRMFNPWVE